MLEDLAVGLMLAAVTGITALAYQHPEMYRYASKPLEIIWFGAFVVTLFASVGYQKGVLDSGGSMADVRNRVYDPVEIGLVAALIYCYLLLLKHVVTRLKKYDSDNKDHSGKPK